MFTKDSPLGEMFIGSVILLYYLWEGRAIDSVLCLGCNGKMISVHGMVVLLSDNVSICFVLWLIGVSNYDTVLL